MNNSIFIAAIATPTLVLASTAIAKWVGRWFAAAMKASMEEAVTDIVKPHLERLTSSMQTMREENSRDHAEVSSRLNALEARVALVEARLTPIDTTAPQGG